MILQVVKRIANIRFDLAKMGKNLYSLFYPCSRGDSGALYSQSATAGVMPSRGRIAVEQPLISDVDTWVLRNRNP